MYPGFSGVLFTESTGVSMTSQVDHQAKKHTEIIKVYLGRYQSPEVDSGPGKIGLKGVYVDTA